MQIAYRRLPDTEKECATPPPRHALGLEVLLEIHTFSELAYVNADVDMVGVNNRNLGTFVTDVKNSFHIAEKLRQIPATALDSSDSPSAATCFGKRNFTSRNHLPAARCRLPRLPYRRNLYETRRPEMH